MDIKELLKDRMDIDVLKTRFEIYNDIARLMADTLRKNNESNKTTSFILPVGPRGQYQRFARICNSEHISCRNLITINMDEFLNDDGGYIDQSNPISFRGFMKKNLFDRLKSKLAIRPENIYFPNPNKPEELGLLVEELGGADMCFSGVGINGHIAFNEPLKEMSVEDFMELGTRKINISRDTIIMTSLKYNGFIDLIPKRCVTIGMKEIAASRKINIYLEHGHQAAALYKILFEKPSTGFPITLITERDNSELFVTEEVISGLSFAEILKV